MGDAWRRPFRRRQLAQRRDEAQIYADNDAPGLKAARELRAAHPEIAVRILYCAAEGQDFDKLYKAVAGDRAPGTGQIP